MQEKTTTVLLRGILQQPQYGQSGWVDVFEDAMETRRKIGACLSTLRSTKK